MEGDKAKAMKAKQIAEEKFRMGDLAGAKESAIVAESLDPSLTGLACLMASIDVHLSAQKRINGEVDWYAVVGVEPTADNETIRSGYRRLALALLSDKHKAPGSDGAYKLLSEAWNVLCSITRKHAYDRRCRIQPKNKSRIPIGLHNFIGVTSSTATGNHVDSSAPLSALPNQVDTFWAMCKSCSTKYEYLKAYKNKNMLCAHCEEPFEAIQVSPPSMNPDSTWDSRKQQRRKANPSTTLTKPNASGGQSSIFSPFNLVAPGIRESVLDQHSSRARGIFVPLRRVSDAQTPGGKGNTSSQPSSRAQGSSSQLRTTSEDPIMLGDRRSNLIRPFSRALSLAQTLSMQVSMNVGPNLVHFPQKLRRALVGKAKKVIDHNFEGHSFVNVASEATDFPDKKIKKMAETDSCVLALRTSNATKKREVEILNIKVGESSLGDSTNDVAKVEDPNVITMSVPDADFYNFDKDRTEASFNENQVWAAYDDSDGMPRFYAIIHSVVSRKPFKVSISWLNSKNNEDLGPINWIGSGFYKTTGNFWIGKRQINKSLNSFSHKVEWTKGAKGSVQIYPKKGEVWALYRNWSPDWDFSTPDEVVKKYDMVEVLEDFDGEQGVTVAPLLKVASFQTIFRRHPKAIASMTFPKKELFRFSHQVASHLLTGHEAVNAPKGFLELDPAAIPLEFLRAFTEEEVREMENPVEKAKEGFEMKLGDDIEKGLADEAASEFAEDETKKKKKKEENILVYKRRQQKRNKTT